MSRILVTGANGQVGQELVNALMIQGYEVIAAGHADLDITSEAAVEGCVGDEVTAHNVALFTEE